MHSLLFLSLSTLAVVASAAEPLSCGVAGHSTGTAAYWWSLKKDTNTLAKCATHCDGDKKCKSYAFGVKEGKCLHYSVAASKNVRKDANSLYRFYERACSGAQPAPSSSPPSSNLISKDGRCGKAYGGATCKGSKFGDCCSQYSYCGSTKDHCAANSCQKGYGTCNTVASSSIKITSASTKPASTSTKPISTSTKPASTSTVALPSSPSSTLVSKDARCGKSFGGTTCKGSKFGDCCSQYSYCGSTKDHCAADSCQKGYGNCNGGSSSSVVSTPQSSSKSISAPSPSKSASTSTPIASPSASSCPRTGVKGYSSTNPEGYTDLTLSRCRRKCLSLGTSKSYGFGKSCASCVDICTCHDVKVAQHVSPSTDARMTYYNLDCAESPEPSTASSASQDSSSSTGATESTESATLTETGSDAGETSSVNDDSPPYTPTGEVVLPTDPAEFTATYTFQDDPLPTPVEMGTAPITSGASAVEPDLVKKCIITPTEPDATFRLLDTDDRIPLVKRADGTLGTPTAPKSEAEFKAMGPIEDLTFSSFSFVAGENGLFDLVINEDPRQYVGRQRDGSVVLTAQSTGANVQLATTIFDVTCEGRVTVRNGAQSYTWKLNASGGSVMQAATGTPETMWTLPDSPAAEKRRRRSKSQEGAAPRCNAYPRELEARVFPGARGNNPNQCGSSSFNVPDLSFGSCCDQHDNDYDDCGMTFEEGNNRFRSCMRGRGCDYLNHWYSWLAYLGCLNTAEFYYSVVSGYFGKSAFYTSNTERCRCYCSGATPHGCTVSGTFQCLNVLGTDTNNCGACGRKCPEGSKCVGGTCKCPAEQCGDRCVTLASHPKNCGQCGRVSPSGYCVQGQFYTPPAVCTRSNGFRNGNFANGGNDWTGQIVSGGGNSRFDVGFDGGADDADAMVGIFSLYTPNPGANLKTQVKMCPGMTYNLGFQIRRPYGTDSCSFSVYVAGENKYNGQVPQPAATGAGWQWVSGLRVGPFSGERTGVTATGPELWADFELQIRCSGSAPYDFIRMDQFTLNPL